MPITDLTGYTWVGNVNLTLSGANDYTCNINFISNNTDYTVLRISNSGFSIFYRLNSSDAPGTYVYSGNPTSLDTSTTGTWLNQAYQTIQITGGTDATSSGSNFATLLSWLEANGTLTAPTPTPTKTFDLSTLQLSAGTHQVKVRARGSGYRDSNFSNSVNYEVAPQGHSVTITYSSDKSGNWCNVYDGQNTSGTLLTTISGYYGENTVTCSSGYLYFDTLPYMNSTFKIIGQVNTTSSNPSVVSGNGSMDVYFSSGQKL